MDTEKIYIEEQIFVYRKEQLDQWKSGNKFLIPNFLELHQDYQAQPAYHFGEIFVIDTFNRLSGWKGFRFYALGTWEMDNPKYDQSRKIISEIFPDDKLNKFHKARHKEDSMSGIGEPDVMLYKDKGESLFLEVKKEKDRISKEQLTCLAQIKSILEADIGIIYLREENQKYSPKKYELDLINYCGKIVV